MDCWLHCKFVEFLTAASAFDRKSVCGLSVFLTIMIYRDFYVSIKEYYKLSVLLTFHFL